MCGLPALHDRPGSDPYTICSSSIPGSEHGREARDGMGQLRLDHHSEPYGSTCRGMYTQHIVCVQTFQRGDRLYTSESDVCRRQILTSEVDPRAERAK